MRTSSRYRVALIAAMFFTTFATTAQVASTSIEANVKQVNSPVMKTYIIKRDIPEAGKLTGAQLKGISQTSCSVLKEMGPRIEWIHSYVTGNNIFCIYKAENEELLREHAKKGGFPANEIIEVATVISPATATQP